MKKLLFPVLVAGLFMSCSSNDNDETIQEDVNLILPTKISIVENNGTTWDSYIKYNNDKIVDATYSDNGDKTTYEYTGNLITKESLLENGKLSETTEYVYNNNKIVKEIRTDVTKGTSSTTNYKWIDSNHMQYLIQNTTSGVTYTETRDFYYTNDNLMKDTNSFSYKIGTNTITNYSENIYTYDNKNNANKNVLGSKSLMIGYDTDFCSNNLLTKTGTQKYTSNGTTTTYTNNYKLSYVYNNKDYPTSYIKENTSNFGSGTNYSLVKATITYNK